MSHPISRRKVLRTAMATGPALGLLRAAEAGQQGAVQLPADIEPLVRLIEETSRDQAIEVVAKRVRNGVPYRDLLAALLLAGVRNVEPRPSVGFKFHAVLVVQSVHLAFEAADERDRWLPVFWGIDYFKDSQAQDERERGWTMGPVEEAAVPEASVARKAFVQAMDAWDEAGADVAVASLARSAKPKDIWELFFRCGARDYRSIGHKAIDVANTHRVLGVVGWKYAEPALRSLAYALLMHEGDNPAARDAWPDRPWRRNQQLAAKLPERWQAGRDDDDAVRELLAALREGSEDAAADTVVELLRRGVAPRSIWDGLFLGAGELLVRQPGIIALHAVTTTNALHYAYRFASEDRTRRLLLLQNASFLPMFRRTMQDRGKLRGFQLDVMEPLAREGTEERMPEAVFAGLNQDPMTAARRTLAYFRSKAPAGPWIDAARRLVIHKGIGPHDFKFGCAVLEDHDHVSPGWRPYYMASSVFQLQGSSQPDNPLVRRVRAALDG